MGKEVYLLSGLAVIILAYVCYTSCVNDWPFEPSKYCAAYLPGSECMNHVKTLSTIMLILFVFGILLMLYSLSSSITGLFRRAREFTADRKIQRIYVDDEKETKRIETELTFAHQHLNNYEILLQAKAGRQPMSEKKLKVTIKNQIINLITDDKGKCYIDLTQHFSGEGRIEITIMYEGDDHFAPAKVTEMKSSGV